MKEVETLKLQNIRDYIGLYNIFVINVVTRQLLDVPLLGHLDKPEFIVTEIIHKHRTNLKKYGFFQSRYLLVRMSEFQ